MSPPKPRIVDSWRDLGWVQYGRIWLARLKSGDYLGAHLGPTQEPCKASPRTLDVTSGDAHRVDVPAPGLTISPSIACEHCGLHGWVRDGLWEDA